MTGGCHQGNPIFGGSTQTGKLNQHLVSIKASGAPTCTLHTVALTARAASRVAGTVAGGTVELLHVAAGHNFPAPAQERGTAGLAT